MTKKDREAMRLRMHQKGWLAATDSPENLRRFVEREVDRAVRRARREERKRGMHQVARALEQHDAKYLGKAFDDALARQLARRCAP